MGLVLDAGNGFQQHYGIRLHFGTHDWVDEYLWHQGVGGRRGRYTGQTESWKQLRESGPPRPGGHWAVGAGDRP